MAERKRRYVPVRMVARSVSGQVKSDGRLTEGRTVTVEFFRVTRSFDHERLKKFLGQGFKIKSVYFKRTSKKSAHPITMGFELKRPNSRQFRLQEALRKRND